MEALVESASWKRGSDAAADNEGQSRGGVRSVKARNLSQIWRKRSNIQRRQFLLRVALLQSSSSADVLVESSVATSVSVEDMIQTDVPISTRVGIQPASTGTVGSLCFNESKARDFENLTNLVLTSNAFPGRPSRESMEGLVKTLLDMCSRSDRSLPATNVQCSLA